MPEITRRRLLGSAAIGAGGVLAQSILPPGLARAAAFGQRRGSLRDVKHVVIQMQENRSFDHYFGTLAGVRGFADPAAVATGYNGQSVFFQPDPATASGGNPDGYLLPWHLDTETTSAQAIPSTSHAWSVQHQALNISVGATPGAATTALNNDWLPAHLGADGIAHGPYTMSYYERQDIPFHFALAETFTLLDGYHCSLLGPTWPNRMYLMTGTIDPAGLGGGPIISNVVPSPTSGEPYTWKTYPERLTEAGISWRIYQQEDDYGTNQMEWFAAYQNAKPGSPLYDGALTIYSPDRFEWDAKHDKLPTVSWIIPTSGQSEHPAYLPASGADFLASKLDAVASNLDVWAKTVFIVNYDENDGLFDHVVPPLPPAGTADEFVDGLPIGGGVRVPAFIVSPWTVGGYVASESFDHTSTLQLLEQLTGVRETNISEWRRSAFGDLTSALGFSNGKATTFPPSLPSTIGEFWAAEQEASTLPAPAVPGATQTPPVQETSRPRLPWRPQSRELIRSRIDHKPLPLTASRYVENRTTHRSDFVHGASDKVFLGRIAEVEGHALPDAGDTVYAFIPGIVGGNLAIADASTQTLVSAITSGTTNPYGVAVTPATAPSLSGLKVWVTESGTNAVSVFSYDASTSKWAVSETIVVGIYPHGIAISPDGGTAYVANTGPNTGSGGSRTVSVIDTASYAVTGTIEVGEAPQVLAVSPDGTRVAVSCADGVYAIAAGGGAVSKSPVDFHNPHGVAFSPDGSQIWVADPEQDQVVLLDARTLRGRNAVPVGRTPWNVAFSTDGSTVYVTNLNEDTVSVVNASSLRQHTKIALPAFAVENLVSKTSSYPQLHHQPGAIAINPGDGSVWVACNSSSSLAVIDPSTNTVVASIEIGLGDDPVGIAFVGVS
ncbi:MAG TPA: alkaline phosphatase family protein [Solirubrobacteraceae bacterium]|jgi:phospholipase C|nr:alkaline phosphatase family protein [Solirubrobacteraceae bacterium]